MSGIQKKIFIGSILFLLITSSEAKEAPSDRPVPVLAAGTRVFPGDPKKDEFYILGESEPDPVIDKKGPAYVNTTPFAAGIDDNDALNVNPEEIIVDATPVFDENSVTPPVQQANVKATEEANNISETNTDNEQPEEVKPKSTFTKVKAFLHKLTQKIAVKKKHSPSRKKTSIATKARLNTKKHMASAIVQNKAKNKHKHIVTAEKHVVKKPSEITVIKLRYV